ncbi:MAG: hypothetical protein IKW02_00995 [Clostridia bacterium]|nr:hypothetical protein [Clostridia bacterium]
MTKLVQKLWNWGHLEGSHNKGSGLNCTMTPEQFAEEYGIKNAFMVSFGGNIQPPFNNLAKRFSGLQQVKWSVLGDASTPLPDAELGNTEDIIAACPDAPNITGGVVDDFFVRPERAERFTPEVLKKIKKTLNDKGLDFWCVIYNHQLEVDLSKYMDCFDGITFWIWECENIARMDEYLPKLFSITKDKPMMLGMYVWDYSVPGGHPMDAGLFEQQLITYFELLKSKKIEGVIFCSSTLGDADLETNKLLKKYIKEQGDTEIE